MRLVKSSLLLVALLASTVLAHEPERPVVRPLLLSEHPNTPTHRVNVKGQVVTTLRFEAAVDAGKTMMVGWEGRLEPLAVVRNKVLLEPLHDLDSDEAIPLAVTLVDGTEVAILLRASGDEAWNRPDQQLNVFRNRETYEAMYGALVRALEQNEALTEENARYRKEENSEDYALAALLTSGALAQTPFKIAGYLNGKDNGIDITARLYQGKGKAAVVFNIQNQSSDQSWSMKSARAVTVASGQERSVAARAMHSQIAPGESGIIALVVDKSAFMEDGKLTSLFLEIYRHDGVRQALIQLDPSLIEK
jgi:uncharacterized protein (TIGR02268 family)